MDATQWDSWTDADVWVPTEEDSRWAAETLNDDWHDLEGHPVIDDDTIDDEARYWEDEARRYAADPTDDDIAEADPWTTGDEYEADGHFDDVADESAWMDAYERGLKTF
jgi:hypothetical protein